MLIQPTLELLHELRLTGMAEAFEQQLGMPDIGQLAFEDRLGLLLEHEKTSREERRYIRLKGLAKLHLDAAVEDLNFRAPRGLDRSVVLRLAACDWIRDGQTLLITGAPGTGKSYLACAFGHQACRTGIFVIWDGMGLVTKRIKHVPHFDPPRVRLKSANPEYDSYGWPVGEIRTA